MRIHYSPFEIKDSKSFLVFVNTLEPEPGLKDGDSWCLCAERWKEAYECGFAPKLYLNRTNKKALSVIDIDILKEFALDLI